MRSVSRARYTTQPARGLAAAQHILMLMTSVPLQWQKDAPTRAQAEAMLKQRVTRALATADANDMIYAYEASREYNPAPHLGRITPPLFAINSADDQVNPPELGILEREIKRVPRGRYILIPISEQRGATALIRFPRSGGSTLPSCSRAANRIEITEEKLKR